jgi:glycosyltransferase involved in cell wall biosynthesis
MKILMVLEAEFPPDIRVENEMAVLSEAGHEVHLACSTRKNKLSEERSGKIFIHRKPISTFIYKSSVGCLKFPFYFHFWRKFLFSLVSVEKFDVIHIHDLPLSIIGIGLKEKYGIPLVIDLHENWPALMKNAAHTRTLAGRLLSSNRQWREYEKKVLPLADMVITIIEEARDRVIALGVDPGKITMVSNTVNTETIIVPAVDKDDKYFNLFYGGAVNRHRGLQIVIEAIRILAERNIKVKLHIVGDGSYKSELMSLTENKGVSYLTEFHGHKPFNEMIGILAGADAAIIPHLRNDNNDASSPNKLYQYMYLNKPVISSDCTSLERIITETDAGFIYRHDSPDELAVLLGKLVISGKLLEEKGKNGRKAVLEKYNWKYDSARLLEAYSRLITKINENSGQK